MATPEGIPLPGFIESPDAGGGFDAIPEPKSISEALQAAVPIDDPEVDPQPDIQSSLDDEFQHHVAVIMAALDPAREDSEANTRRCLAEIHAYLAFFDKGFRQMGADVASMGGPMQMFRKMILGK